MFFGFLKSKERIEETEAENKRLKEELERIKGTSNEHLCGAYCAVCINSIPSYNPIIGITHSCKLDCNCKDFEQK